MDQNNWSKEQTTLLISLYEQCSCLYDPLDPDFVNRVKREEKLNFILNNLKEIKKNVTVKEIKSKIKTLQSQLSKEKMKILNSKKSGAGADNIYTPKLWCYDQLQFLLKCNDGTKGRSNINISQEISEEDIVFEEGTQITKRPRSANELCTKAIEAIELAKTLAEEQRSSRNHYKEGREEEFEIKYRFLDILRETIEKENQEDHNHHCLPPWLQLTKKLIFWTFKF